jgi:acyl-CoA hydrolase/GNAT superfamily N-acetyltransferase
MVSSNWQDRYRDKICTAEAAIRLISPGRRIMVGSHACEPNQLVNALVTYGDHLADNEIVHLMTLGSAPYVKPGLEKRFRHTAFFIGANTREAVQEGRADFMPVFLSEIPALISSRRVRIDVLLVQVSPPDAHGYCSLGVSVDITRAALDAADLVFAEVNEQMPRTHGDSFIHVDRLAKLIPVDSPLHEHLPEPLDEIDMAIGRHIASVIPNGATLQLGIGKIPDATLAALDKHHDLGVHTEMFSDGVKTLVEKGVITCRKKTLLPGKIVTSFIIGSRALYQWTDDNPFIEMRSSGFTNDPFVIARNDNMIAINAALAVDLTGQVAADTLMGRFFSGIGGQVDFIRGAARSRGGKPIIALRSTAKNGTVSRIVAALEAGAGVVTSRGDVHFIATEYGIVDLWGKNIRQRALKLIEIAHPDHRGELLAAAKQRKYVFPDQVVVQAAYPWREARTEKLPNETSVLVRPARISDEEALRDLFYRLSDENTYRRFMLRNREQAHDEMVELANLDYENNMALVVTRVENDSETIIGMARYDVDLATRMADVAFIVLDEQQNRGIGTLLMRRMVEIGKARGLAGFSSDVLVNNKPMMAIIQKSGEKVHSELRGNAYHVELCF